MTRAELEAVGWEFNVLPRYNLLTGSRVPSTDDPGWFSDTNVAISEFIDEDGFGVNVASGNPTGWHRVIRVDVRNVFRNGAYVVTSAFVRSEIKADTEFFGAGCNIGTSDSSRTFEKVYMDGVEQTFYPGSGSNSIQVPADGEWHYMEWVFKMTEQTAMGRVENYRVEPSFNPTSKTAQRVFMKALKMEYGLRATPWREAENE